MCHIWKKGQASQEVFKCVVSYGERKLEAKAQLELNMATSVKDNKKWFYKHINSKRRGKKNLDFLLDMAGNIATKD